MTLCAASGVQFSISGKHPLRMPRTSCASLISAHIKVPGMRRCSFLVRCPSRSVAAILWDSRFLCELAVVTALGQEQGHASNATKPRVVHLRALVHRAVFQAWAPLPPLRESMGFNHLCVWSVCFLFSLAISQIRSQNLLQTLQFYCSFRDSLDHVSFSSQFTVRDPVLFSPLNIAISMKLRAHQERSLKRMLCGRPLWHLQRF